MSVKVGTSDISKVFIGTTVVQKIYLGTTMVWQAYVPDITRVGAVSSGSTSVTLPTHQAGDLIVIFAFRRGSGTAPSLASGYTNLTTDSISASSIRIGYRTAPGSGTSSGTWTNATGLLAIVYRGASGIGNYATNTGAAFTNITYPAVNLTTAGTPSVIRFGMRNGGTVDMTSGLTNYTLRANDGTDAVCYDRMDVPSNQGSQATSTNAGTWVTASVEILESPTPP